MNKVAIFIITAVALVSIGGIQYYQSKPKPFDAPLTPQNLVIAINIMRSQQHQGSLMEDVYLDQVVQELGTVPNMTPADILQKLADDGEHPSVIRGLYGLYFTGTALFLSTVQANQPQNYQDVVTNPAYTKIGVSVRYAPMGQTDTVYMLYSN